MIGIMCTYSTAQYYWQHRAYSFADNVAQWQLLPVNLLKEALPSAALPPDQVKRILGEFGESTSAKMISEAISSSKVLSSLPKPIHLLFDSKRNRKTPNGTVPHICSDLPPESMCIAEGFAFRGSEFVVCMPTPEMSFVQVASEGDLLRTVMYGCYLCGMFTYETNASGNNPHRRPVVTVERLANYIGNANGMRGVTNARKALRFIVEHAATPLEAKAAILLCMPLSKGGFGLPHPEMNHQIYIPEQYQVTPWQSSCLADMCWPQRKIVIEIDNQQRYRDSAVLDSRDKVSILQTMGYHVQSLSYKTLCNPTLTRKLIREIRDLMEMDRHVTRDWRQEAHIELRKQLFDPCFGSVYKAEGQPFIRQVY